MSLMEYLINGITQNVKTVKNIPLQIHKNQTHTSAADLTLLENTGREDVTELQLEKCQW